MNKSIKLFLSALLLFFSTNTWLQSQVLLQDDFKAKNNYWYWRADGNQSIPTVENGLLKLNLVNAIASEYCNTEIYDPTEPYLPGTQLRVRLKYSPQHIGSRGWGFWDGDLTLQDILFDYDVAWVMQQGSDNLAVTYNWSLFGVSGDTVTNRQTYDLKNTIKENEWNTYSIIWKPDSTFLLINDSQVYVTTSHIPNEKMRFDVWIDNRVININNPANFWNNNSKGSEMLVDFVEISGTNGPAIKRETKGNIIFWESPNTFPSGKSKSLWKNYPFNTPTNGDALIYLNGSAESYHNSDEDDDLKIVLDNFDFGWDNENSLNGDVLNGNGTALSLPVKVNSGNHSLEIHTDITPFLSDVIVLFSENGKVIYNKQYNERAEETNGLWKTISFITEQSSNITFLVAGTFSVVDNLRIEIDNKDFGSGNVGSIMGNYLQSMPRTIVVDEPIEKGLHSLKIYKTGNPILHNISIYGNSTITEVVDNKPTEFTNELKVFPNPFNITTTVFYQLAKPSNTKISIYNNLGELEKTLFNGYQSEGKHYIQWNAEGVSSGMYLCTIVSEGFTQTKKILLLK